MATSTREILALTTNAVVPRNTGAKSIDIQNLGPNPIWVALGSAAAVVNKCKKIGAGESWSVDAYYTIPINIIASTANQVTGAATIITEV